MTWNQCDHSDTQIRAVQAVNGGLRYRRQCMVCGVGVGQWIKKVDVAKDFPTLLCVPAWDDSLAEAWARDRDKARKEDRWGRVEWSYDHYKQYIASSPVWKNKRARVLDRDNHQCRACHRARATQVHHLTYQHLFDEPLFELVSVCGTCHQRLHDPLALAERAAIILQSASRKKAG